VTEDGGDFTVHRAWGVDEHGDSWLLPGGYRAQATSDKWIEAQLDLIEQHKPLAWFGEAGVIQKAVEPMLFRRMRERKVYARIEWLPSIADKPTRARGFQARAAMGTVHFPEGPEGDAILDEYLRFPTGRHDDDVDNGSLLGRALDMAHPAIAKREAPATSGPLNVSEMTFDQMLKHADQMSGGDRV
jgi:predicted phage terminase large subunit-like protein